MDHKGTYPFILLLALTSFADAQSQSCPRITINDLGNTTEISNEGLIARAIVPSGSHGFSTVPVRIRNFAIVCDAAGDRINTSSFVSVVVEFQCNFQSAISSLIVCNDPNTIVTRQYQFQCIEQNGQPVWGTTVAGSNLFVQTLNPTATLSTPLVDTCRRCIDDRQSNRGDPTTHCDLCPAQCNQGQGRCFLGQAGDVCCNFYLQNKCIDECPSGLVSDSNSVCVCPPLTLGNGTVSYSMEMEVGVERNVGSMATHTCISGYQLLMQDGGNTRICSISGWSGRNFICVINDTVNKQLDMFRSVFSNLMNETYVDAVATLSQILKGTENNTNEQTDEVLGTVAIYLDNVADFVNTSQVVIDTDVVRDVINVVNSFLQWEPGNITVASSSSAIESLERIVSLYAQQLSLNETQHFVTPSLTLITELKSIDTLAREGRGYFIGGNNMTMPSTGNNISGSDELSPQFSGAIGLPASLFQQIDDRPNIGIFFALYESPSLFPVAEDTNSTTSSSPKRKMVGSQVLAATVGFGIDFQNLSEDVTVAFQLQVPRVGVNQSILEGTETCVSWDFTVRNWVPEGCTTIVGDDDVIICKCNHLTNFAVLVDICLRQEDCAPSAVTVDQALTYISYIGTSISIVCLIFTLITILGFKKILQKDVSKYHIQLCIALLCMYILTLILVVFSAERVDTIYGGCVTLSLLVHYFTLAAVMWMGAEAVLMFQKLVIVFVRITTKYIVIMSIICWTAPTVFVLIPFIVDLANGHNDTKDIIVQRAKTKHEDDISYCFLSQIGALIGAFLVPIFIVMVINTIIFIWVIVIVKRHAKKTHVKQTVPAKQILRIMFSISGVLFLFGLSWLFFILTVSVSGLRETFQVLFTVFSSLQGFFVFVFILFTEGFGYWKSFLSCKKYRSSKPASNPSAVSSRNQQNTNLSNLSKQEESNAFILATEIDTEKFKSGEK